ncbi:aminotransferase family protein [Neptunicoccus cionae]|uniref:aminotransferase family protein n=1 Tax=Neptunicoccus cionae TaxID=2035344 RepID=UPI000C75E40C|nr:aminotransferase class III-fold pyridoxal phosphate-dependent enzyme [Amylibacter cionae]PLS21003.1 aspartate aminotransferase family protein [Amylibacter cionae]
MKSTTQNNSKAWIARDEVVVQHPGGGGGEHTVVLSYGKGACVWDVDGRKYLDAQGGAWLNKVGYGRKELADIAARQMQDLACFSIGFDYANQPSIEFAEKLVARAPDNITKVRYETGGGEADDHALQLARIYQAQKGHSGRRKILVHREAYHGGTMGGVELTGGRPGIAPPSDDVILLTPPRPYHTELYGNRDMTAFCVDELRNVITKHGADSIAAMFGELMIGPGGMIPLPDDYWPAMTAVLKEHGILFVADEVVTGFGRAGEWFMSAAYGIAPDMIVLAKGICSGYVPMAAVMMSEDVAETVNGFGPGNSYAGHPVGAAVASAHIDIIERENLLENSKARGAQFLVELSPLQDHPLVGNIRGRGLMLGIELVKDKDSRAPLTQDAPWLFKDLPRYVRHEYGILLGLRANVITLTPPLVIDSEEVSQISQALIETINKIDLKTLRLPDPPAA